MPSDCISNFRPSNLSLTWRDERAKGYILVRQICLKHSLGDIWICIYHQHTLFQPYTCTNHLEHLSSLTWPRISCCKFKPHHHSTPRICILVLWLFTVLCFAQKCLSQWNTESSSGAAQTKFNSTILSTGGTPIKSDIMNHWDSGAIIRKIVQHIWQG